jgi:hypothetical protein
MLLHANARTSGRRMWGIRSAPRHGAMHANTLAMSQSDGHGHGSTPCHAPPGPGMGGRVMGSTGNSGAFCFPRILLAMHVDLFIRAEDPRKMKMEQSETKRAPVPVSLHAPSEAPLKHLSSHKTTKGLHANSHIVRANTGGAPCDGSTPITCTARMQY